MSAVNRPQRDRKWRQAWQTTANRVDFSRPTDAVFAKAEHALLDPERDVHDKRCAALAGVPQQVSPELCLPMWIPARELSATFSDTEIMTSLGSTAQSPLWSKSLEHLRDFKTIRNAGISFMCTDREVCTKLGGESVNICGRAFKVQTYSKYSHWYYVDLQRLPDDVSDGLIYDWFAQKGTPPVYITPAHIIGGLRSRNRRVYFNQKSPPRSVMLDKRTPLRQIQFTGQGFAVVHHRLSAYNRTIPPFIAAMHAKKNPTPAAPTAPVVATVDADDIPPAWDNASESSGSESMADISGSEGEPHSGDHSESDSSLLATMDGIESAITVRPKSIWVTGKAPKFPVGAVNNDALTPDRITRAKRLIFGTIAEPEAEVTQFPPSQVEYPFLSSLNSYEWLSEGTDGPISPDQDIILWDRSQDPPRSVRSFVNMGEVAERILNSSVYQGSVEELTLKELCAVIDDFVSTFDSTHDPDSVMTTVQAQPSLLRVLLDTKAKGNFHHLRAKVFGHAVLRVAATRDYPSSDVGSLMQRLGKLYPDKSDYDFQSVLSQLCPDQDQYWGQVKLAEFDLAIQIVAPSVYMDPLKLGTLLGKAASALPHPIWLLWDDPTLASLVLSPLLERILGAAIPFDLRDTINFLRERATTVAPQISPSL
ncbi:hypothetical protein KXD40_009205 [Peronospora effusa]|nr:hypothetical protein KXD40_009205 [Peronospora effusa]